MGGTERAGEPGVIGAGRKHGYSVPARHIGRTLRARIFEDRVEFWDGAEKV